MDEREAFFEAGYGVGPADMMDAPAGVTLRFRFALVVVGALAFLQVWREMESGHSLTKEGGLLHSAT